MNLEKEFALFERKMLLKYGLKPYELEKIELFTLNVWSQFEKENKVLMKKIRIIQEQQQIFERMKIKNGRTNN